MTRTDIDINSFKQKLLEEETRLKSELETLGTQNPNNPNDWEVTRGDDFEETADPNDRGDSFEEFEDRAAILAQLETQFGDVRAALDKIEGGTYGICEVNGEPIEVKRLEANPAARTCIEHMNQ